MSNSMNPFKTITVVMMSFLLTGCLTMSPSSLSVPGNIEVAGSYIHKPSGMMFPKTINDFQRVDVYQYDKEGLDVSVGYNLFAPPRTIVATMYVYPAPKVVSIGSPPSVIAVAQDIAAKGEFESRKQEIMIAHPGAIIIEEKDVSLVQAGKTQLGKMATFQYEDVFLNKSQTVEGRVYLFCYVSGNWIIKYRFSYPKSFDATKDIDDFMQGLSWNLTSP